MSEAEFLANEAANAKAAFGAAWKELTATLKHTGDITAWAKRYPIITTGAAAVAGFVASYAFIPASKTEAREKWDHLKTAVSGSTEPEIEAVEVDGRRFTLHPEKPDPKPAAQGVLAVVVGQLMSVVRPMLMSFISTKFGGQPPEEQPPAGHGEERDHDR